MPPWPFPTPSLMTSMGNGHGGAMARVCLNRKTRSPSGYRCNTLSKGLRLRRDFLYQDVVVHSGTTQVAIVFTGSTALACAREASTTLMLAKGTVAHRAYQSTHIAFHWVSCREPHVTPLVYIIPCDCCTTVNLSRRGVKPCKIHKRVILCGFN